MVPLSSPCPLACCVLVTWWPWSSLTTSSPLPGWSAVWWPTPVVSRGCARWTPTPWWSGTPRACPGTCWSVPPRPRRPGCPGPWAWRVCGACLSGRWCVTPRGGPTGSRTAWAGCARATPCPPGRACWRPVVWRWPGCPVRRWPRDRYRPDRVREPGVRACPYRRAGREGPVLRP
nr:MAG TPA: hypothetical protein [Caudoviricetes sp.]